MSHIQLSTVSIGGKLHVLVYDVDQGRLVHELCDYAAAMADREKAASTVVQECIHLRQFWAYLRKHGVELQAVNDDVLRAFRDSQLRQTVENRAHRGSQEMAKTTVNAKLRRVYHWLHWLQEDERVAPGLIGPRGQVRSALERTRRGVDRAAVWTRLSSMTSPLAFRVPGAKSKHQIAKEVPSEETVDRIHAHFFSCTDSDYLAHRNCLLVDLAAATGLRRGSINSLLTQQFTERALVTAEEELWVRPEKQKFSYVNSFPIPLYLGWRIHSFVAQQRQQLIVAKDIGRSVHEDRIFLSERDGRPLTDRAISQIVSAAMRAAGLGRGVSIHALRTKFASEEIDRETAYRLDAGLDTSATSVAQAVAMKLGHRSPTSLFPYAVASQSKKARMQRADSAAEVERLRAEVRRLRAEVLRTTRS